MKPKIKAKYLDKYRNLKLMYKQICFQLIFIFRYNCIYMFVNVNITYLNKKVFHINMSSSEILRSTMHLVTLISDNYAIQKLISSSFLVLLFSVLIKFYLDPPVCMLFPCSFNLWINKIPHTGDTNSFDR